MISRKWNITEHQYPISIRKLFKHLIYEGGRAETIKPCGTPIFYVNLTSLSFYLEHAIIEEKLS